MALRMCQHLAQDRGVMLNRPMQLMNETRLLAPRLLTQRPAEFPDDQRIPDNRRHRTHAPDL